MPKIVVKRKEETYKEFLIQPIQEKIRIGAEGDNDLIIADKRVSQHHLVVLKEGNQYYIEDLNSESGTILNNKKVVQKVNLNSGDTISIGDHSLIFENILYENNGNTKNQPEAEEITLEEAESVDPDEKNENVSQQFTKTPTDETIEKEQVETSQVPDQKSENFIPHYLLSIHGPYLGKKYPLNSGITKIGRDKTLNDIIIRETKKGEIDTSISRRHATVFFEDDNFYISDKRSKTRTWVNRKQLDEEDLVQLIPKDEIRIASDQVSTIFRFTETGKDDFSRPRKAGFWWDRNAFWMGKIFSFLLTAALILLIVISVNNIKIITQKPGVLTLEERILFSSENDQVIVLNQDEVLKNAAALAPAVADLNGDNFLDIIFLDKIGNLQVINGKTYLPLWKENFPHRAQLPIGITLADLNDNNRADIILAAFNSIVYAIDGRSGNEIWASPILGGPFSGNPVVADLNGDKLLDVFISDLSGKLHIGFGGFSNPEWASVQLETKNLGAPSGVDVNNDNLPEVVFGSEKGQVFVYNGTERRITQTIDVYSQLGKVAAVSSENHSTRGRIAGGVLNNDPFEDIVILTEGNHLLAFDVFNNHPIWYDISKTEADSGIALPPTVGDLNGDKGLDVAVSTKSNEIITYNGFGNGARLKKTNWRYHPKNKEQFVSIPVIADINKDFKNDLVVANYFGGINIFNGKDGTLLTDLKTDTSDSFAVIGTPVVADLNNNGWLDILLRKNDGSFSILESNSRVKQGSIIWGQFNLNAQQNGCLLPIKNHKILYFSILAFSVFVLILLFILNLLVSTKRRRLIKLSE
ncbi:FHA domain-containing protein [candidate division KSB1 bacterium]|nr:FHA domain-containing protein [candidate division KSB1 bacterium]